MQSFEMRLCILLYSFIAALHCSSAQSGESPEDFAVIGLEFESYTVDEGNRATICARVMNGTLNSTIILLLSTASPLNSETPASADADYSSIPGSFSSGRLIFRTFTINACVTIRTTFDSLVEGTEDFLVQLRARDPLPSSVKLAITSATVFILDDDEVGIGFDQSSYLASESDGVVVVCIRVSQGGLQRTVQVTVNTEDGTATAPDDYIATSTRTTVGGLGRSCVSITLVDDNFLDGIRGSLRESFTVFLESNDSAVSALGRVSVFIRDNDVLVIGLERENYTVSEAIRVVNVSGSGNTTGEDTTVLQQTSVRVCAVVLNGTIENGTSVRVRFTTESGTATGSESDDGPGEYFYYYYNYYYNNDNDDGDYTTLSRDVNISNNGTGCVDIEARDDDLAEGPEQFFVTISTSESGIIIQQNRATVTILDDEEVLVIGLERESYTVSESIRMVDVSGSGNTTGENTTVVQQTSVRVCAVVIEGTIEDADTSVRVRFTTRSGTATGSGFRQSGDYNTTLNREVRISENGTGCVDIEVVDDDITEGPEQFLVDISLPSGTIMGILIQPNSTATVTILDDDVAVIGFTQREYSVIEGNSLSRERVPRVATLQGSLAPGLRLNLRRYTMDGSATEFQDYRPSNTTGNRFSFGSISSIEDEVVEGPETFFLRLELADDIDIPVQFVEAVVTILDDDGITVGLEETAYSVVENAEIIEICAVLLQGSLAREASITLSTTDGSAAAPADYSVTSIVLTFNESTSRSCGSVPITLDSTIESEEFFSVSITTTDRGVTLMPETLVRVTISDSSEVVIGFETVAYEVNEGQNQEFCVAVLNGELKSPVEVTLTTEDGTALAPGDYLSGALRIVLTESANQICVNIPTVNDTAVESTETFFAKLSTDDLRISLLPATAIIFIVDDDKEESTGAADLCLPHLVAAVSIRAVLSVRRDNQCPTTQELQSSPFTQFLIDEILDTTFFGPGCTFLSAELSSCVARGGRTIATFSAGFTCNGRCIPASSGFPENTQISNAREKFLMDTIAEEQGVSTTFEDSAVRITYFWRGQQSAITAVCSAGVAVTSENNLCNCPADCS